MQVYNILNLYMHDSYIVFIIVCLHWKLYSAYLATHSQEGITPVDVMNCIEYASQKYYKANRVAILQQKEAIVLGSLC